MKMAALIVSFLIVVSGTAVAADLVPDCSSVPGWSQKGEVRSFESDNLFDYMDGNAEGYIIYDFQQMKGVTCISGENQVLIDFSEMISPELAYGIFAANRHPRHEVVDVGMGGQMMPRKGTFVKGKLYVEISSNKDALEVVVAFAEAMEPKLPGTTEKPAELGWFPEDGLDASSVRLVPQSVLGLRALTRGYLAQYEDGRAFLVAEESPEAAAAVISKIKDRLSDVADAGIGDESVAGTDRYLGSMCVARKGSFVVGGVTRKDADLKARTAALAAKIP